MELTEGPFPPSKQATVLQARLAYQSLAAAAAGAGEIDLFLCQELLDCVTLGLSSPLRRVHSLIWKGRAWRIVRIVSVFHRTNDSRPFKLLSYFFPSQMSNTVFIGSMLFWWMYWMGSNCDVELLSVCVCLYYCLHVYVCVQPRCSRFAHFMVTTCPFFLSM